jgi:hypothetical protein
MDEVDCCVRCLESGFRVAWCSEACGCDCLNPLVWLRLRIRGRWKWRRRVRG